MDAVSCLILAVIGFCAVMIVLAILAMFGINILI